MFRQLSRTTAILVLAATPMVAQSRLDTAAAKGFMGIWNVELQSPQGNVMMTLDLMDEDGKVAGTLDSDIGFQQVIEEFSMSGDSLVLRYTADFQGQSMPSQWTITRDGDAIDVRIDFSGMPMSGRGTRPSP